MKRDAIYDVVDAVAPSNATLADMATPIVRDGNQLAWRKPRSVFTPIPIARRRADKRELFACMLDAIRSGVPLQEVMRSPLDALSRLDSLRRHYKRSNGYWDDIKDDPRIALSIVVHSARRVVIEDAIHFYLHAMLNSALPKTEGDFEVESRALMVEKGMCLEGKSENETQFLRRNGKGWRGEVLEPFRYGDGAHDVLDWFDRPFLKVRIALSEEDHFLWQVGFSGKAMS